jgi:hypothetical protein
MLTANSCLLYLDLLREQYCSFVTLDEANLNTLSTRFTQPINSSFQQREFSILDSLSRD